MKDEKLETERANTNVQVFESKFELSRLLHQSRAQLDHFLLRRLKDPQLVEEVVQQTHLEATKNWHTFRGDSSRATWLFGIAVNVAKAHLTRRVRSEKLFEPLDDESPSHKLQSADTPLHYISRKEEASSIMLAFNRLSPEMREVFSLIIWDGMSYEEASDRLGIPLGTVRSRLSRAKSKFQQQFLSHTDVT